MKKGVFYVNLRYGTDISNAVKEDGMKNNYSQTLKRTGCCLCEGDCITYRKDGGKKKHTA